MGAPENVRLVELGPGRGTMMLDALRAAQVVPDFRKALVVHLVEISPALEQRQRQALSGIDVPVEWHQSLDEVPDGPIIILANEFFDALPVHQAVMCVDGWHERVVKIADNGSLQFSHARDPIPLFDQMLPRPLRNAPIGAIFEWRADQIALEIGRRVVHSHGAALVIDYGHAESAAGDTFQAVGRQAFADPLQSPGHGRPHRPCRFPGAGARGASAGRRRPRPDRAGARSCAGSASRPAPRRSRRERRSPRTPRSTARSRA